MGNHLFGKLKKLFGRQIDQKFVENSRAFCLMPWIHLHITQYGTVTPCCQAPWEEEDAFGNINRQNLAEIWHGKRMNDFRKTLINDQKDDRCQRCYKSESAGLMSLRKVTNMQFADKLEWAKNTESDGSSSLAKPIYWDIRFSNLCNFRCRICGPWSSSRWYDDARQLGMVGENTPKVTHALEDFDALLAQLAPFTTEVEEIYFAGGEPLIMDEHYRILDFLEKHELYDVRLRYSTNFSVTDYKGRNIFKTWKRFNNVIVNASLDDMNQRGEHQRKEQQWQQVIDNRRQMIATCPHVDFVISATINVFNVWSFPDFHRRWHKLGLISDIKNVFPGILEQPDYYNICILPPQLKQQVKAKYLEHITWMLEQPTDDEFRRNVVVEQFRQCITHMESQDLTKLIPIFIEKTVQLDALRGENNRELYPDLEEVFSFKK